MVTRNGGEYMYQHHTLLLAPLATVCSTIYHLYPSRFIIYTLGHWGVQLHVYCECCYMKSVRVLLSHKTVWDYLLPVVLRTVMHTECCGACYFSVYITKQSVYYRIVERERVCAGYWLRCEEMHTVRRPGYYTETYSIFSGYFPELIML
jgi:hypothetical protein